MEIMVNVPVELLTLAPTNITVAAMWVLVVDMFLEGNARFCEK